MEKSFVIKMSIIAGLLISIFLLFLSFTPFATLMPIVFIGLTITFAYGAKFNEIPNYITSIISGMVWGIFMFWFGAFLSTTGMNENVSFFIENFILGTGICLVHMWFLGKTWANKVPLCFAPVCVLFITGGKDHLGIIVALISGVLLAVMIEPLTMLTVKKAE